MHLLFSVPVLKDMSSDPKTDLQNMMSSNSTSNCLATSYTLGSHQPGCPSIVLYLVIAKETDCKEFIQILDVVDKVMNDECVPYEVRKLLFIQVSVHVCSQDTFMVFVCLSTLLQS